MPPSLIAALYVAAGGGAGALARYLAGLLASRAGLPSLAATLAVNVLGCWALGLLHAHTVDPRLRLLLGTGALGGFTTFSTFALDAHELGGAASAAYVLASVGLGLAAFHWGRG